MTARGTRSLTLSDISRTASTKKMYSCPFWSCLFSNSPQSFPSPSVKSLRSSLKQAAMYGLGSACRWNRRPRLVRFISFSSQSEKSSQLITRGDKFQLAATAARSVNLDFSLFPFLIATLNALIARNRRLQKRSMTYSICFFFLTQEKAGKLKDGADFHRTKHQSIFKDCKIKEQKNSKKKITELILFPHFSSSCKQNKGNFVCD